MTNLLYGSEYLYRFGSGSNFIGYDVSSVMNWAILTSDSILNIWFEKHGGTTSGAAVKVGDTVYLATDLSSGVLGRYLIDDARDFLRWDIVGGAERGRWLVSSPGLNAGDPIPIYSNVTFELVDVKGAKWLAQETGKDYLQLSDSTPLTLASTDT